MNILLFWIIAKYNIYKYKLNKTKPTFRVLWKDQISLLHRETIKVAKRNDRLHKHYKNEKHNASSQLTRLVFVFSVLVRLVNILVTVIVNVKIAKTKKKSINNSKRTLRNLLMQATLQWPMLHCRFLTNELVDLLIRPQK